MRTDSRSYSEIGSASAPVVNPAARSMEPVAGFYRGSFGRNRAICGFRVWYGPPADPVTGEIMDRSYRWQIEVNGAIDNRIDMTDVLSWARLLREKITEAAYQKLCAQAVWARDNAPNSSLANPRSRSDVTNSPLYF